MTKNAPMPSKNKGLEARDAYLNLLRVHEQYWLRSYRYVQEGT
jgi:hypothetical protein